MNKWKHACCNGVSLAEEVITELKNCVNLQLNNVSHCISFIFHGWKGFWVIKILHHVLLTVFFLRNRKIRGRFFFKVTQDTTNLNVSGAGGSILRVIGSPSTFVSLLLCPCHIIYLSLPFVNIFPIWSLTHSAALAIFVFSLSFPRLCLTRIQVLPTRTQENLGIAYWAESESWHFERGKWQI